MTLLIGGIRQFRFALYLITEHVSSGTTYSYEQLPATVCAALYGVQYIVYFRAGLQHLTALVSESLIVFE